MPDTNRHLVWKKRITHLVWLLLITGFFAFVVGALVYPKVWPAEMYRFHHTWFTCWTIASFLVLCQLKDEARLPRTQALTNFGLVAVCLLWLGPGLIVNSYRLVRPVQAGCTITADVQAAQYVADKFAYSERILIVNGPKAVLADLYGCDNAGLMGRVMVEYTGGPLPLGFYYYTNKQEYNGLYNKAMESLDETALASLKIGLLYLDPATLTPLQTERLAQLQKDGKLQMVAEFDGPNRITSSQAHRIIYKLNLNSKAVAIE